MIIKLVKTRAVKAELIRCTVEVYGNPLNEGQITSEYELIVNSQDFTEMHVDQGITEMMINVPLLQQILTQQVSELTLTGGVAAALNANPQSWLVTEAKEENENDTISNNGQ